MSTEDAIWKHPALHIVPLVLLLCGVAETLVGDPPDGRAGHEMLVVPGDADHSRNSEADIVELKDGRLLLGWTQFYKAASEDWSPSRISGKTSKDGGLTWSDSFTILENEGKQNTMEVDFLRVPSGDLLMFYCRKNGNDDLRVMMRKSKDEGKNLGRAQAFVGLAGLCGADQ